MPQLGFNCRVGRSYPPPKRPRFNFERFLHRMKWHAFNLAVAIVFLSWLSKAVWHEVGLPPGFAGEQKANFATISDVAIQTCKVTISDMDGVEHSTHVTAATFYEAIARGVRAIKGSAWADEIPEGTTATVCASQPTVEHKVTIAAFKKWLSQPGRSPADKIARANVREILQSLVPTS